jgi:hypothetical protein
MTTVFAIWLIVSSSPAGAETPSEFLSELVSLEPSGWVDHLWIEERVLNPDTVLAIITPMRQISVEPGRMTLEDIDGGYRALFPNSRWSWRMSGGRVGSASGLTVVVWRPGGYRLAHAPLFTGEVTTIGPRESLCMGAVITGAIITVMLFAVWYAKRRYG